MGKDRSGIDPLSYMGVDPSSPPLLVQETRAPVSRDTGNYNLGTLWVDIVNDNVYILTNLELGVANWDRIEKIELVINTDSGVVTPTNDTITITGAGVLSTSGATDVVTISLGGGTNGQLLVGGGSAPTWANLTSSGSTLTIAEGINTLDLDVDDGIIGSTKFLTDSGTAFVAADVITFAGGSSINTAGAGSTVTVNVDASPTISSLTVGNIGLGIVQSDGSGVLSEITGTDGQVLIGATGTDAAFGTITSGGATIAITGGTNTVNLELIGAAGTGKELTWTTSAVTPVTMVSGNGYICDGGGLKIRLLPATSAVGDMLGICTGASATWRVTQNAGQWIATAYVPTGGKTTTGVTGNIEGTGAVKLVCIIADTAWRVFSSQGTVLKNQ